MISQSENNIKKSALRFLKMYYRHRPRTSETNTKVDQITKGGIIADGMLSFSQENSLDFVASVEATSFDTRDEVKYKMQYQLLNWDAFMWGCIITAILVLFGHYFHWFAFGHGDFRLVTGLVLLFSLTFFAYRYTMNTRVKYRYIYALQQFKQYHADEQWVAIGDNVFYGAEDPALEELRKQCVRNGFGLLTVDKELATHLVISPSREELFGSSRKMLSFVGVDNLGDSKPFASAKGLWGFVKSKLGFGGGMDSLFRFQKNYYKPMLYSFLMLGLIGFVAYEDLKEKDFVVISDEAEYDAELEKITENKSFDEFDEKIDAEFVEPNPKKTPDPYLAIVEKNKRNESLMKRAPLTRRDELTAKGNSKNGEIIIADNNGSTSYDCTRFFNLAGKKYAIQDGQFKTLSAAERRLNYLRRSGIKAHIIWLGCFFQDTNDYIIYVDWLYEDKNEAINEGKNYRKNLRQKKIKEQKLVIRTLEKN